MLLLLFFFSFSHTLAAKCIFRYFCYEKGNEEKGGTPMGTERVGLVDVVVVGLP